LENFLQSELVATKVLIVDPEDVVPINRESLQKG
jgi:hypothetical protein